MASLVQSLSAIALLVAAAGCNEILGIQPVDTDVDASPAGDAPVAQTPDAGAPDAGAPDAGAPDAGADVIHDPITPCVSAPPPPGQPRKASDLAAIWSHGDITANLSTTMGFETTAIWTRERPALPPRVRWLAGDFDGDHVADLAAVSHSGDHHAITVWRSTGDSFVATPWATWQASWAATTQWLPEDFDGDGMTDIAAIVRADDGVTITVHRSTGTTFMPSEQRTVRDGVPRRAQWVAGRFDEGVRADLAEVSDTGDSTVAITMWRSLDTGFTPESWAPAVPVALAMSRWIAGDFDGDGLSDLVAVRGDPQGGVVLATFDVLPSTGSAFAPPRPWAVQEGAYDDTIQWTAGDFDGRDGWDLAAIWNDGGTNTLTVRLSTGTSFTHNHWAKRQRVFLPSTVWCAGAFDPE